MNRRTFLAATGGGILLNESAWSADSKPQIIEMRTLKMRNTLDGMAQRTNDFLEKAYIPALQKAGAVTVGAFSALVAPDSPFLLLVSSYPSLGSWEGAYEKLRTDASLTKAREAYYGGGLGMAEDEGDSGPERRRDCVEHYQLLRASDRLLRDSVTANPEVVVLGSSTVFITEKVAENVAIGSAITIR
jgi:hypothetical protein